MQQQILPLHKSDYTALSFTTQISFLNPPQHLHHLNPFGSSGSQRWSTGSSKEEFIEIDSFLFDFGNENLLRLLTFIPCRFPLIPVPPTGFTGWRGPILQSRAPRGICRNSQIGPRGSGPPPLMIIVGTGCLRPAEIIMCVCSPSERDPQRELREEKRR